MKSCTALLMLALAPTSALVVSPRMVAPAAVPSRCGEAPKAFIF